MISIEEVSTFMVEEIGLIDYSRLLIKHHIRAYSVFKMIFKECHSLEYRNYEGFLKVVSKYYNNTEDKKLRQKYKDFITVIKGSKNTPTKERYEILSNSIDRIFSSKDDTPYRNNLKIALEVFKLMMNKVPSSKVNLNYNKSL